MQKQRTQRLVYAAILAAQAIVIGYFEAFLPSPAAFAPGAKLGLANLMTVVALFSLPPMYSFVIVFLRVFATALMFGTFSTFLYSIMGGLFSLVAMLAIKQLGPKRVSLIGISTVGGFMHNLGQLTVAAMIAQSPAIYNYLPILTLAGVTAGFFIGVIGNYLIVHLSSTQLFRNDAHFHQQYQQWIKP
ncbi:MAG: Gx transporter family protein [Aerococcus sp.]|nr:Gx transporter family protein [Aerococcus sp.]